MEKIELDKFAFVLDYINKIFAYDGGFINPAKILLCALIVLVVFVAIYLLKKRRSVIFVAWVKTNYDEHTKKAIINASNRPLILLLELISFRLCVSILSHPYEVASFLSIGFSIAFKAVFAWLVIGISKGYGLSFINAVVSEDSEDDKFRKDVINLILKIFYFLVLVFAFLLILGDLGVNVSAIIASLGIGGLAVAWASKDILANFFASILLLIDNSFSQGDWIVCNDVEGIVVEIGLRRTTIRTFDNALLFVPNSILINDAIRNWSRRKVGRRIKMSIGLTYDSPKEKLELCVAQIRSMLETHPDIANPNDTSLSTKDHEQSFKQHVVSMEDFKGYRRTLLVYLDEFSSSSIDILVYCFSKSTKWEKWLQTKQDVMFKIIDIVESLELEFAFPSQSLYIEKMGKEDSSPLVDKGNPEGQCKDILHKNNKN